MGQINTTVKYPSVTYPTTVTQLGTAIDLNTSEVAGQLGIANGGTGSPTASGARSSLGVVIGTDVQAYSPALTVFASNSSSYYLSRDNHTGTQNVSTVTGLTDYATLTSTVPVVSGGTGSPTASGARANLGLESYTLKSSGFTIDNVFPVIYLDGTFTAQLPAVSSLDGCVVTLKNIGTGSVLISGNASEAIDGVNTISLSSQWDKLTIQSTASGWMTT